MAPNLDKSASQHCSRYTKSKSLAHRPPWIDVTATSGSENDDYKYLERDEAEDLVSFEDEAETRTSIYLDEAKKFQATGGNSDDLEYSSAEDDPGPPRDVWTSSRRKHTSSSKYHRVIHRDRQILVDVGAAGDGYPTKAKVQARRFRSTNRSNRSESKKYRAAVAIDGDDGCASLLKQAQIKNRASNGDRDGGRNNRTSKNVAHGESRKARNRDEARQYRDKMDPANNGYSSKEAQVAKNPENKTNQFTEKEQCHRTTDHKDMEAEKFKYLELDSKKFLASLQMQGHPLVDKIDFTGKRVIVRACRGGYRKKSRKATKVSAKISPRSLRQRKVVPRLVSEFMLVELSEELYDSLTEMQRDEVKGNNGGQTAVQLESKTLPPTKVESLVKAESKRVKTEDKVVPPPTKALPPTEITAGQQLTQNLSANGSPYPTRNNEVQQLTKNAGAKGPPNNRVQQLTKNASTKSPLPPTGRAGVQHLAKTVSCKGPPPLNKGLLPTKATNKGSSSLTNRPKAPQAPRPTQAQSVVRKVRAPRPLTRGYGFTNVTRTYWNPATKNVFTTKDNISSHLLVRVLTAHKTTRVSLSDVEEVMTSPRKVKKGNVKTKSPRDVQMSPKMAKGYQSHDQFNNARMSQAAEDCRSLKEAQGAAPESLNIKKFESDSAPFSDDEECDVQEDDHEENINRSQPAPAVNLKPVLKGTPSRIPRKCPGPLDGAGDCQASHTYQNHLDDDPKPLTLSTSSVAQEDLGMDSTEETLRTETRTIRTWTDESWKDRNILSEYPLPTIVSKKGPKSPAMSHNRLRPLAKTQTPVKSKSDEIAYSARTLQKLEATRGNRAGFHGSGCVKVACKPLKATTTTVVPPKGRPPVPPAHAPCKPNGKTVPANVVPSPVVHRKSTAGRIRYLEAEIVRCDHQSYLQRIKNAQPSKAIANAFRRK